METYAGLQVEEAVLQKYPWLRFLLHAFDQADKGVAADLARRASAGQRMPVCKAGCSNCCLAPTVPVTRLELQGISWYVAEVLKDPTRTAVRHQLLAHRDSARCPFLVDAKCALYPVRPLACRQHFVLTKPCGPDEDILQTRPDDNLPLGRKAAVDVATTVLQGLGLGGKAKCRAAARDGALVSIASPMHRYPLEKLVEVMDVIAAAR